MTAEEIVAYMETLRTDVQRQVSMAMVMSSWD